MREICINNTDPMLGFFYGLQFTDELGNIEYDWSCMNEDGHFCGICDEELEDEYALIIVALKKSKLIPADFKLLCCVCYRKKEKEEKENERRRKEII